jgi:uncharacterized RDD family membrane protein YckC
MLCAICGEICRCSSVENEKALPRWLPDSNDYPAAKQTSGDKEEKFETLDSAASLIAEGVPVPETPPAPQEDSTEWRQELSARLNRYQSRRKPRPPRYPSLRLKFEAETVSNNSDELTHEFFLSQTMPQVARHALAFDPFDDVSPACNSDRSNPDSHAVDSPANEALSDGLNNNGSARACDPHPATARIIEFPRSWTPPPPSVDELAEPVISQPRILEVPEFVPPPPALGGITIEPVQQPQREKRPGIDIPLHAAPFGRRVLSAILDCVIIGCNCLLFGVVFWKLTAIRPPRLEIATVLACLWLVLWGTYQYLLLVYTGSTPGLRLAGLELVRFDGSAAGRKLRRWRVLASFLSGMSLGMGYAWAFLDEDSLCWHDRITHTYLAPERHAADLPKKSLNEV